MWDGRKFFDKETIDSGEEAVRDGLIIEIVPGLKLVNLDIEAGYNVSSRCECGLDATKKRAEGNQQEEP